MTFSIKPLIIIPQDFGALVRRDDCLDTVLKQIVDKILGSIPTISNQSLKIETDQQSLGLGTVVALTGCQTQSQGISQAIHCNVDFATKASTTSSQGLLTTFFVRLRHRDVPAQLCCQSSPFPYRDHGQSDQAFVPKPRPYTSERYGQHTPLGSAPTHPFHRFNKAAAGLLVFSNIGFRLCSQEIPYL